MYHEPIDPGESPDSASDELPRRVAADETTWEQFVAYGMATIIALGGMLALMTGTTRNTGGTTRSAKLEFERRQAIIEQAERAEIQRIQRSAVEQTARRDV